MTHTAESDAPRCIAITDRHTVCKGKAVPGGEFCRRHGGRVTSPDVGDRGPQD